MRVFLFGMLALFCFFPLMRCGDECETALDCDPGLVCYQKSCEPAPGISCQADADCNNAPEVPVEMRGLLCCQRGQCLPTLTASTATTSTSTTTIAPDPC